MRELKHEAILGLGGNIGEPKSAMATVIRALASGPRTKLSHVSKLYRTPPWGKIDQPDFYNACVAIKTDFQPVELLDHCLELERSLKRERLERWGPRTIDIDILMFGNDTISTERLIVPHPRMTERAFVLLPLSDFAASAIIANRTVSDWLMEADQGGIVAASYDGDWWRSSDGLSE